MGHMTETAFTDEQTMLRDSVERFIQNEYTFEQRRKRLNMPATDRGCWGQFAAMGWLGLPFAEAQGGFGGSTSDVALLMREFGRGLVIEPFVPNVVLAGSLLARLGTPAQCSRYLAAMIDGRAQLAFAFGEAQSRFRLNDCLTQATTQGDDYVINGRKTVVHGGATADAFVVLVRTSGQQLDADGLSLLMVERGSAGVDIKPYRTYDGHTACELTLHDVRVEAAALLGPAGTAFAEAERALDYAAAMSCAEATGVLDVLFNDTLAYTKERQQFGRALASNQALQHRLVDMHIQLREAQAMVQMAVESLDNADDALRRRAVSAAKVLVGGALRLLGQEAVQMHGAIGTTDDLRISHVFKRATLLGMLFGDADWHRQRLGTLMSGSQNMTPLLRDSDRAFADEVRAFIRANLPPGIAHKVANEQLLSKADFQAWAEPLGHKGWLTYTWPTEYGGPGWTPRQQFLFEAICVEMDCAWIVPLGPRMVAQVIQHFGTPAQKERFLPPIQDSSEWWCQGYSEPGAGSDLASLTTRAELRGDKYIINGQKIWTSYAHYADWMFCLVRTSREAKNQRGISFLLIDMKSPGIEVRPIVQMDGAHSFNSVFFTDVEVPVGNLIGEEGAGWTCAKYLLTHERLETASLPGVQRSMRRLRQVAYSAPAGGQAMASDPSFRNKLMDVEVRMMALELRVLSFLQQQDAGGILGPEVSQLKIRGCDLYQNILELIMEAAGYHAMPYEREYVLGHVAQPAVGELYEGTAAGRYFSRRSMSILGGSNEVQRNVLAKTVLGI